jgi:hypothetical protein
LSLHVDTVVPDVTFTIENAAGGVLSAANAALRVISNIPGDDDLLVGFGFEGQLITPDTALVDAGAGATATAALRLPADAVPGGVFTFEAVVVDTVGNLTRVTQTVALPPAPSAPQLVIDGGAAFTSTRDVLLRLAAQDFTRVCVDNLDAHECFDAAEVAGEVPFQLATTSGKAVVVATFVDGAEHAVSASDSIVVDVDGPQLSAPVTLDDGARFATSVSATLTVDADGADEMAVIIVDGDALTGLDVGALTFQPYARQSVVLLPSGDGDKTVCVVLRDAAGNLLTPADDHDACKTTTLDTTEPASPVVLSEDGQVLRTPSDHLFRAFIAPLDADVDHLRVTVEGPFGSQRAPAPGIFPVLPPGTSHPPHVGTECAAPPSPDAPGVPCFLDLAVVGDVSDGDDTPHLFRLTAVDRAGNVSAQATFSVTYDDQVPGVPRIADADVSAAGVVFPRQGRNDVAQVRAPKVNADSFAVRIVTPPNRIDRNFDHYEVARTVGKRDVGGVLVVRTPTDGLLGNGAIDPASALRPDLTDLPFTASAGADSLIVPLVQGAPLNGSGNDGVMCTPRACLNHIFLRAVDAAGNVGPALRIDIVEDSGPPTRPTLSPRSGTMVGAEAAIELQADSIDDSDFCDDVADCDAGLTCDKNLCVAPSVGGGVPVRAYELKQGTDGSFGGVPPGQPVEGPWRMQLVRGDRSSLCARGVDDAGNVGIEDCVDVDEESTAPRLSVASAREKEPHIAGDYVVYRVDDRLFFNDLAGPAPVAAGDDALLDGMIAPRTNGNGGGTGVDVAVDVDNGVDLLAIAAQGAVQDTDVVQVRFGHPHPRVDEAPGSAMTTRGAQRTFRGSVPSLLGHKVTFACTSSGRTTLMRADLDRLFTNASLPAGVVTGDIGAALTTQFSSCPAVDVSGTFTTLTTLDAGKRLCTNTSPVATITAVAWCETSSSGGTETGNIVALVAGSPATVPLGAAATSRHGDLVDGGVGLPIRPVASAGRLVWVDAVTGTIHDLASAPGAQPRDTGIPAGDLYDLDVDQLVYADRRDDGLTDDLYTVDLRPALPAAQRLTDDLPPNSDGAVAQGRIVVTALSSRGEDVDLLRTGQDAWLASSDTLRFLPATSATRAAWVEVVDAGLAVLSVDVDSGEQATVVAGPELFNRLSFVGGSFLGNAPVDVGGDVVALARQDVGGASWTASFFAVRGQVPAQPFTLSGIAAAQPGTQGATLAWDVDVDGDAVGYVDIATGNLVVQRIVGSSLTPVVSVPSGRGLLDTTVVPYVAVDDVGDLTVAVWQLGNVGTLGDVRRDRMGVLTYTERRGATTTTAPVRAAGGGSLVGRDPSVAIVNGRVFLAWQTATLVNVPSGGGFVVHRARLCEVVVTAGTPTCVNERALDETLRTDGDSGAPVVSRRGFVAWPNGAGRLLPQIDLYDIVRNARISLTAGLDDGLARDSVVTGGDLVVWLDGRLGTSDVWYATAP